MSGAAEPRENVLFLFAHQDDEVGIATRIAYEARRGNDVWCAYLTDGARDVGSDVRDRESTAVLLSLGVVAERIAFLADSMGRIPDGTLACSLARARAMMSAWIASTGMRFARMFTMDWEGGHHDHDATHLVALGAARDAGIPAVYAYPFYNGYRRRTGWFRVASFVPGCGAVLRRRLSLSESTRAALNVLAYPSQRRTWLGLGPGFMLRMLLRRTELLRQADPRRLTTRPHEGVLLYEAMFKVSSADVLAASAKLRAELQQPHVPS